MDDLGQAKTMLDLRAPEVWEAELGIRILDPDGWRSGGRLGPRDWEALITRAEFEQRAARSTCSQRPEPGVAMDDLVPWLTAQVDEDERVASAAPAAPWRASSDEWFTTPTGGVGVVDGAGDGLAATRGSYARAHVIRWDPARVLAEVEAKRAILRRHQLRYFFGVNTARCLVCRDLTNAIPQRELGAVWPCQDVRALALPYRDRPGYRPEWAPEQ